MMAKKTRVETGVEKKAVKTAKVEKKPQAEKKVAATEKMTSITFRTRLVQKKKAEKVFEDMGISMSGALNMFLAQAVRDKAMPFLPNTERKGGGGVGLPASRKPVEEDPNAGFLALEEMWDEL